MKHTMLLLLVLAAVALGQRIDVYFGTIRCEDLQADSTASLAGVTITGADNIECDTLTVNDMADLTGVTISSADNIECDTLTVNDVANLDWAGVTELRVEDLFVDSLCHLESDSVIIDNSLFLGWMSCLGDAHVWGDFRAESTATVAQDLTVGDTLAVNLAAPEYIFHVYYPDAYVMFEGDNAGVSYVLSNTNATTAEVGYGIMRRDTLRWTVEDSNGTFIIFQADSVANRLQISPTTGNVTIPQNLGVTGWITSDSLYTSHILCSDINAGGATDTIAWIDEIAGDTLQAIIVNGIVTSITNY